MSLKCGLFTSKTQCFHHQAPPQNCSTWNNLTFARNVSSGTPATGTITGSPVSIAVGSDFSNAISFQPLAVGSPILTIAQPAGFNSGTTSNFSAQIPAVVNGP
jgi:hypothetical protein